jgi:hypothetical protein
VMPDGCIEQVLDRVDEVATHAGQMRTLVEHLRNRESSRR